MNQQSRLSIEDRKIISKLVSNTQMIFEVLANANTDINSQMRQADRHKVSELKDVLSRILLLKKMDKSDSKKLDDEFERYISSQEIIAVETLHKISTEYAAIAFKMNLIGKDVIECHQAVQALIERLNN